MGAEKQVSEHPDTLLGGTAIKPVGWDRTGWEAFQYLLYNPETGAVLTRTPLSWLKIFVFYCIYYSCLAGFWAAMLVIFFTTIPADEPRWMLDASLIGVNPGLGMKPPPTDEKIDSSMFFLNGKDLDENWNKDGEGDKNIDYARRMQLFFEKQNYTVTDGLVNCAGVNKVRGADEAGCIFDPAVELKDCATYPYGYISASAGQYVQPCIFLKFNKIFNWKPTVLSAEDEEYQKIPKTLQDQIKKDPNHVWVECHGRNPADKEILLNSIEYFPKNQGIPVKYFPFMGNKRPYHPPMVAVKIKGSEKLAGQLIHVECKAWFKGVVHDSRDKMGLTQFEVLIEPPPAVRSGL